MKIDTSNITDTNLKTKLEKKTDMETQDGFSFRDFIQDGMPSLSLTAVTNDFISNNFISDTQENLKSLKSSYKYDCITMDRDDAIFFANAIKGENYSFNINGELLMQNQASSVQDIAKTYKSAEVSKTLMDMLAGSQQTNKPVRIDFGNDISAILRVNSEGKISAEFIPSDKVAEEYLKNNISYLQQTFEKQDIPYSDLSYRQRQKNKQNTDSRRETEEGDK